MRTYLTCLFVCAFGMASGNAAPTTCPSSGTYATLTSLNTVGGCTIDNLLFSNFTFASTATGGATAVAPSDVVISGVLNSAPLAVGFDFNSIPMLALLRQTSDVTIGYTVSGIFADSMITSAELTEVGRAIPDTGDATIDETVNSSELHTYFTSTLIQKPSDSVTFPGMALVSVSDHLHATGGIVGAGQITGFSNTFNEGGALVPEPASLLLLACGLAVVAVILRRREKVRPRACPSLSLDL